MQQSAAADGRVLIENLYQFKVFESKKLIPEFSDNGWNADQKGSVMGYRNRHTILLSAVRDLSSSSCFCRHLNCVAKPIVSTIAPS